MKYRIKEIIKTYNGHQEKTYEIQCKILCWWGYWFDRYSGIGDFHWEGQGRVNFQCLEDAREIKNFLETNTDKDLALGFDYGRFVYIDLGSRRWDTRHNRHSYLVYSESAEYVKLKIEERRQKEYKNKFIGKKINYYE